MDIKPPPDPQVPSAGATPEERIAQCEETIRVQTQQIAALTSDKEQLEQAVAALKAKQEMPTPTQLVSSFVDAMKILRKGLAAASEDGIGYTVSQFDVALKTQVAVQEQVVRFLLPAPGESIAPESLSTVHFVLATVPVPISPVTKVPPTGPEAAMSQTPP